jgi:hypothetical protein
MVIKKILLLSVIFLLCIPAYAAPSIISPIGEINRDINRSITHTANITQHTVNTSANTSESGHVMSDQKPKDYSNTDLAADVLVKASDLIFRSAADGISTIWKGNNVTKALDENKNVTDEYGATRGTIYTFITHNPKPDEIPPIKKFEDSTYGPWAFLLAVFIFGVPIKNTILRSNPEAYSNAFGKYDISDNKYIGGAVLVAVAYFAPDFVLFTIDCCTYLSQYAMMNVLEYIEPSFDNAYMYFFMAVGEAFVSAFFIVRPWIIDMVYAASRLLAVWYFIGIWHGEVTWIWDKYFKILTLQVVCIFFTCGCLIGIKYEGWEDSAGPYIVMFLFIFLLCYAWMFENYGMNWIKKGTRYAVIGR